MRTNFTAAIFACFAWCALVAGGMFSTAFPSAWARDDGSVGRVTGGSLTPLDFRAPVNGCRFMNQATFMKWWHHRELLGQPVSNEQWGQRSSSGASGTFMLFERGSIMRVATGPYAGRVAIVRGGIAQKYNQFAGPRGLLGYPIADEYEFNAQGHDAQHFEGGAIRWSDRTGDFAVIGRR